MFLQKHVQPGVASSQWSIRCVWGLDAFVGINRLESHIHGVPKCILAVHSAFMKREMSKFLFSNPEYDNMRDTDSNRMKVLEQQTKVRQTHQYLLNMLGYMF
jgi:hypothetical protein